MEARNLIESDHAEVASAMDEWWGRPVSSKLPRLFFRLFSETSFAIEDDGDIVAFSISIVSPCRGELYVHFCGVRPDHRGRGLARKLYETTFDLARKRGCTHARCTTSPVNSGSVAFHRGMGFELVEGDAYRDGIPVHTNYDGDGSEKVVFAKPLGAKP